MNDDGVLVLPVPVMVVAGSLAQAQDYARENGLGYWRYVYGVQDVLGCRFEQYVLTGTWYEKPGIDEILRDLEVRLDMAIRFGRIA